MSKTEFFQKYPSFDYRKEGYLLALAKYQNQLHSPIEITAPKNCACEIHKKDSKKSCKTKKILKKKVSRKYKASEGASSTSSSLPYFAPRTPTPPASHILDSRIPAEIIIDIAIPAPSIEFLPQEESVSSVESLNPDLMEEVVNLNKLPVPKKF